MDWMEMLKQIFQVCIIPLLGILTVYIVKFINAKSEELKATANNKLYQKYITLLTDTITSCVIATNQTYVDALKDKNAFDKEAQKEAFNRTYNAVLAILTDDVKNYFAEAVGDFQAFLTEKIEAEVKLNKKENS